MTRVELQVLRDLRAFTRPYIIQWDPDEAAPWYATLPPGWDQVDGMANTVVSLEGGAHLSPEWRQFSAGLAVDGMPMGFKRPGAFMEVPSDVPSCVLHFGVVADPDIERFSGWWSLTVRCVE